MLGPEAWPVWLGEEPADLRQLKAPLAPYPVSAALIGQFSEPQRQERSSGAPADWAMQAFALARHDAYGPLSRPGDQGIYALPPAYTEQAVRDVALQLSRAGIRLALALNQVLAKAAN